MRMLSSTTANLRNRANELHMFAKAMNAPYILPETKESTRISMRNAAVELEHAADTIDELRATCADLYDYIDELKALVRDMWRDVPKTESCGWDSSANTCTGSDECRGECALWYRMHELGIEVDDA